MCWEGLEVAFSNCGDDLSSFNLEIDCIAPTLYFTSFLEQFPSNIWDNFNRICNIVIIISSVVTILLVIRLFPMLFL